MGRVRGGRETGTRRREALRHTRAVCRRAEWRDCPSQPRIRACSRSVMNNAGWVSPRKTSRDTKIALESLRKRGCLFMNCRSGSSQVNPAPTVSIIPPECRKAPAAFSRRLETSKYRKYWREFSVRQELLYGRTASQVRWVPPRLFAHCGLAEQPF